MLTEERYALITRTVDDRKAVTVAELTELLETSESTIRRDLNVLHKMGKINKVHGGATSIINQYTSAEDEVAVKYTKNTKQKEAIARYAAQLVHPNDFVYIDAGTTTEQIADYLTEQNAVYVTNGINLAKRLAQKGFEAYILAGKIKGTTEAIIGSETINSLMRYNFSLGFFGTNGVSIQSGYTTPDIDEARTKSEAVGRCKKAYVLADPSKFNTTSAVSFAEIGRADIITTVLENKQYKNVTTVYETERKDDI